MTTTVQPFDATQSAAWLHDRLPSFAAAQMAPHHLAAWNWFEALRPDEAAPAYALILARGGGKSTTTELGSCYATATGRRRFVLYVCGTQDKANEHVQSCASILESLGVARELSKYGHSRGWKQSVLRAAGGFYFVAQGLDAAARGVKIDWFRPDLIVIDDVDAREDTAEQTAKKIRTLTQSILPAQAAHGTVVFVQNLVHENSIAAQLASNSADFLRNRAPVQVIPAAYNLDVALAPQPDGTARYIVNHAEPTWVGQDTATIEHQINLWGYAAFRREAQHEVDESEDGLWNRARDIDPYRVAHAPDLPWIVIGLDPNATGTGDEVGITVGGANKERTHGYMLADLSGQYSPAKWTERVVQAYHDYGADAIIAEDNNGGEMVALAIRAVDRNVRVIRVHATRGKRTRAEPIQDRSERGFIHHVGMYPALEKELTRWVPGDDSPNRLDAYVWCFTWLLKPQPTKQRHAAVGSVSFGGR